MITITADDNLSVLKVMRVLLGRIDPNGTHLTADSAAKAFSLVETERPQVIFLDIEMPGISGIEAARKLSERYPRLNIIFITGHSEYALEAHEVFCSGFLCKPVNENDIRRALSHLRFPIESGKRIKVRCGSSFDLFVDDRPFRFKREKTAEMFAYLVYKRGAICQNSELLTALWGGDLEKKGFLRQLVLDLKTSFEAVGINNITEKSRGSICLDPEQIETIGSVDELPEYFGWLDV